MHFMSLIKSEIKHTVMLVRMLVAVLRVSYFPFFAVFSLIRQRMVRTLKKKKKKKKTVSRTLHTLSFLLSLSPQLVNAK